MRHLAGHHDARVAAAAAEAGLQLRPRNVRVFDEVVDIVNFDLVVVLDHFDLTEVRSSSMYQLLLQLRVVSTLLSQRMNV